MTHRVAGMPLVRSVNRSNQMRFSASVPWFSTHGISREPSLPRGCPHRPSCLVVALGASFVGANKSQVNHARWLPRRRPPGVTAPIRMSRPRLSPSPRRSQRRICQLSMSPEEPTLPSRGRRAGVVAGGNNITALAFSADARYNGRHTPRSPVCGS